MTDHLPGCAALRCVHPVYWDKNGSCSKPEHHHHHRHNFQPGPCNCALGTLRARVAKLEELIGLAKRLLDDAFDICADEFDYDPQGVNQAHRILAGGEPPREG